MPASATLRAPLLSLNYGGQMFKMGVTTPVSFEIARKLRHNPRFLVEGLDTAESVEDALIASRPESDDLMESIRDANDALDLDDDSNFDRHGKPDHRALSEKLGYPITPEERDRALGYDKVAKAAKAASAAPSGQLETAEGRTEKTDGKIAIPRRLLTAQKAADPSTAIVVAG